MVCSFSRSATKCRVDLSGGTDPLQTSITRSTETRVDAIFEYLSERPSVCE